MIENLPDALEQIVEDMQSGVVNTDDTTVSGSVTTFSYITAVNIYKVGMWVEFSFPTTLLGVRYKIATLTQNNAESYTITIDTAIDEAAGIKNVVMRPFIRYKFGHPKEIQQILVEETEGAVLKKNKYPILVLYLEYEESHDSTGYLFNSDVNIAIITDTLQNWKAADRLTYSFKQKLYPLYKLFIEKLTLSNLFDTEENLHIKHKKADRYFYSATDAKEQNSLASLLDAIEINELNLNLVEQSNC